MSKRKRETTQIWRERVDRAKSFNGSAAEFCRREGIELASFYGWRKRFKREARMSESAFVPAIIDVHSIPIKSDSSILPDAKWVGEFLAAMMRGLS